MASPTQWTWVWVNSGSWRWTGRPGVLQSMGSQRVWHNWVAELTDWSNNAVWLGISVRVVVSATSSVQFSHSVVSNSLWSHRLQPITNSRSLLKLMSIKSVMPSNYLILCCPFLLLPSIFSSIRVFSNESVLRIRWPKYWSFSISLSNMRGWFPLGLTGLISLQSKGLSRVFSSAIHGVTKSRTRLRELIWTE